MKIISADYIYTPNGFLQDRAIAFNDTIEDIDTLERVKERYPNAKIISTEKNSIIYPGFINSHVHLEFSANITSLKYGSFMSWLDSVIAKRDELIQKCNTTLIENKCKEMMLSGVTSFGAISSFGMELEACKNTPQRVVFFNELIGSNASYADMLYGDFLERLTASQDLTKEQRVVAGIAIHSPYSVHPIILQKAIGVAKELKLPLTTHFLESKAEREWLTNGSGEFKSFFQKYFNTSTPVTTIEEFIHAFDSYPTHFTHSVQATEDELDYLANRGHSIAHCPRSNRYLGCGRLEIEKLNLPFSLATDGLSSNDSLSILDEMRASLMIHSNLELTTLAKELIDSVTFNAAKALHLDCGIIEAGKQADFAVITLPEVPRNTEEIPLWTILHTKEVSQVYIQGKQYV